MTRHEVHSMNTHTAVDKNRPNRTWYKALEPAESQSYRHFLQLHWRQNH